MQKITPLFILLLVYSCSNNKTNNEQAFELKGKLTNANSETVFLEEMSPTGLVAIDSTKMDEKGEFVFHSHLPEAGFYNVKLSNNSFATLLLDSTQKVLLEGNAQDLGNTYKVEGSEDSKLFWQLNEASKNNYRQRDSLQQVFQSFVNTANVSQSKLDSLDNEIGAKYNVLVKEHETYLTSFIDQHLNSFATFAAVQQLNPNEFMTYYEKLDKSLTEKQPNSKYVKLFHEKLIDTKRLSIGSVAPELSITNPDGKEIALSSLKGKIVLIDFWASWCGPCREETPNLVKLYKKYNTKGFEIYSVSLDKERDKWLDAIMKDKMTWIHVSDMKFWNSPVIKLYNFKSIPTTYLIDREGKIIAKNLRGEELAEELKVLFQN